MPNQSVNGKNAAGRGTARGGGSNQPKVKAKVNFGKQRKQGSA
jgi:hypothetical protein